VFYFGTLFSVHYFTILLSGQDLGQLLDGLRARAEAWAQTGEYLETGYTADDSFVCEECSDPTEAKSIAAHYQRIITQIEQQVRKQGGWS
jgi:hypothetical protein